MFAKSRNASCTDAPYPDMLHRIATDHRTDLSPVGGQIYDVRLIRAIGQRQPVRIAGLEGTLAITFIFHASEDNMLAEA